MISGDADTSILPANLQPGRLNPTERELLLRFWHVADVTARDSLNWRGKATEGAKLARAYPQHKIRLEQLRTFLQRLPEARRADPLTGEVRIYTVGKDLDALFDSRKLFNRSDAAGNLMQCLLHNVHRLAPQAGYTQRCALAMAYWMAADSYGKVGEKDYDQEVDGFALIEKIVNERPKEGGGHRKAPFWAKAHPTPIAALAEPVAALKRPAHRPAGDRDRMLAKIRRYFELRAFESDGKIYYHVDDLAERFGLKRRTMQSYLHDLEIAGEIERHQDAGPGGRAWLIWGADNFEKTANFAEIAAPIWGADESAIERVPTPKNDDLRPVCIGDHLNLNAPVPPAAAPAGAVSLDALLSAPAGAHTLLADDLPIITAADRVAAELDERVARDAEALARCWAGKVAGSKRCAKTARFTGRDRQQVAAKYATRRTGPLPTPALYREPLKMPEASLPEPPRAAPIGASPPANYDALGLIATLKARKAGAA